MKFSFEWLQEFVEIPCSPEELAEKLTLTGFECEGIESIASDVSGVVTGKITSIEKHPDADKLVVTQIDIASETVQIVTGATNVFVGAVVPVSLPGAKLSGGLKIKVSKLRGVESYGMLCSEVELGLSDESKGIWILPDDTPLGVDLVEWAKLKDTVIDFSILPNRGDCQSILGLAREVAVACNSQLKVPEFSVTTDEAISSPAVRIEDPALSSLYSARRLELGLLKSTPIWMQRRLLAMGIRPIHIAVDITNYVMLEMGQPLHAFNADAVEGTVCVRESKENESVRTLDDQDRDLPSQTTVIADDQRVLAIAGVMGGASSEVKPDTQSIILESASFDKTLVRRKALECGLRTDSSLRFEKGIHPRFVALASERAASLYQDLCGAKVSLPANAGAAVETELSIPFSMEQINTFLGATYAKEDAISVLKALGFEVTDTEVKVPYWRQGDVTHWQDLAEEIGRLLGFDQIVARLPLASVPVNEPTPDMKVRQALREQFRALGFDQVINFPMISPKDYTKLGLEVPSRLVLQNPLSPEESVMRPQLLPSLLKVTTHNLRRQQSNGRYVEFGRVFDADGSESLRCEAIVEGLQQPAAYQEQDRRAISEFAYLRGIIENVLTASGCKGFHIEPSTDARFHPKKSAQVCVKDTVVARFGVLHPFLTEEYNIKQELGYFELDIDAMAMRHDDEFEFAPFSKFPASDKDVAFVVPKSVSYQTLYNKAIELQPKQCIAISIFDYFESSDLGDSVSMALRLRFQTMDGTLSDEEVNKAHQVFIDKMSSELGITIR